MSLESQIKKAARPSLSQRAEKFFSSLFYSLRSRLLLLTLGIAIISMGCVTWASLFLVARHLEQSVQLNLDRDITAAQLFYDNASSRLQGSIHSISLDNTVKTTLRLGIDAQLQKHLQYLLAQHNLDFLLVTDGLATVQIKASPSFALGDDLYQHPVMYRAMLENGYTGTVLEEDPIILEQIEAHGSDIEAIPVLVLESAQPIVFRSQTIGMVMGGKMISRDAKFLREMRRITGSDHIALLAGNRIAAVSDSRHAGMHAGSSQHYGIDYTKNGAIYRSISRNNDLQSRYVFQYSPLGMPYEDSLAAIVCFRDRGDFSTLLFRLQRLILAIAGVALLLALFLSLWMSRSIAAPLHQLSSAMRLMRAGESIGLLPAERRDEVGELILGYNRMAATIDQRILELAKEITARRKTEQQLARETEKLQVTLHSLGEAVLATNAKGEVELVNRTACVLLGQEEKDLLNRQVDELFYFRAKRTGKEVLHPVTAVLEERFSEMTAGDLLLHVPGGKHFLVTANCAPLQNDDGEVTGTVLVMYDVTEKRKMEEELAKSLKLESVGVLAGGIAHDFNNLLTAILGNVSLAKLGAEGSAVLTKNLEEAEKACIRASELTKQLLTFSKGGAPVRKAVSLGQIIKETVSFVVRGSNVKPVFEIDEELWLADIDSGQISQVLDNLVINGVQAMPKGGEIKIRASNLHVHANSVLPLRSGRYIQVSVEDTGIGIAADKIDRIFDPYYTTKEQGSGLGLAISYAIVSKHGGHITVDSVPGAGTIFYLYLPAAEARNARRTNLVQRPSQGPIGSGRLLLMDDESMIRKVVGSMLERLGYKVVFADDGREALKLYTKNMGTERAFDAVILDLTIPGGMGGEETIKELKQLDPDVRAIVSSGYADHPIMADYEDYGFCAVVAKPFRVDELAGVLSEVITQPSENTH